MGSYVPEEFYRFCDSAKVYEHTRPSKNFLDNAEFMLKKKKLFELAAGSRLALCFSILYDKKIQIRLIPEQPDHDFELKYDKEIIKFQFTECLEQGRKRDLEYKEQKDGKLRLRPYRPSRNQELAIPRVLEAIRKKMKYSDKPNLLVYLNFHSDPIEFVPLSSEVNKVEGIGQFTSIWALLAGSVDYDETSIGCLYPAPQGWLDFNCATGKRLI